MGAWGLGSFENDDALDWILELKSSEGASLLEATLAAVETDGPDSSVATCALAAAEVVAGLAGRARAELPDEAAAWIERHNSIDTTQLTAAADRAIQAVLSDGSELRELWEETDEYAGWLTDVNSLRDSLNSD